MPIKEVLMKKLALVILILATFTGGFIAGQHDTITNAQLTHVTDTGYEITYHGQVHYYYDCE
jgi:hypothetical protein